MDYTGYCMRVDARDGYADKIKMLVSCSDYDSIISVRHQGATQENPHYHVVVKTNVKDQAFRVRMKKIFDQGKGNGHMSIKPWDGRIEAISYLFHEDENAQLVLRHNISDDTLDKARTINKEVRSKVEEAKNKASWKLEDEVYKQFEGKTPTTDDLAKAIILTALRSDKYVPNDYLLKAMVTKLHFRLCNGDVNAEEALADAIVWRIFHKYD